MLLEAGMLSEADAPTAACSSWGSWRGGPLSLSASDRKEVRVRFCALASHHT